MGYFLRDFVYDAGSGVHVHPSAPRADGLADGDTYVVEVLLKAVDLSSYSGEIPGLIKDWPSRCQLSHRRNNVFEAVGGLLDHARRALLIGSGCGAMARWLGERFPAVDAFEDALSKAVAAQARVRDLQNVRVFSGDVASVSFDRQYGLAAVIGALDGDKSRAVELLKRVGDGLAEGGVLLLAAENRNALKYLSGCRRIAGERDLEGIFGPSHAFSRAELEDVLREAGFGHLQFLHAFPDYQLAETVVLESDEVIGLRPYNWIRTPFEDPSGQRSHLFSELLALKSLTDSKLLWHFSNSFLVLASQSDHARLAPDWLIKKFYNADLHHDRRYHHCTTLVGASEDKHEVRRTLLRETGSREVGGSMVFSLQDGTYVPGESLSYLVLASLTSRPQGEGVVEVTRLLRDHLLSAYGSGTSDTGYPMIRGAAVDCTFWNVVVGDDGGLHVIDAKWRYQEDLPVDFVLFRSLFHLFGPLQPFLEEKRRPDFILSALKELFPACTAERLVDHLHLEERLQSAVAGRPIVLDGASPPVYSVSQELERLRAALTKVEQLRAELDGERTGLAALREAHALALESNRRSEAEVVRLSGTAASQAERIDELRDTVDELHGAAEGLKTTVEDLTASLEEKTEAADSLEEARKLLTSWNNDLAWRLSEVEKSAAWKLVQRYRAAKAGIIPIGSKRDRLYRLGLKGTHVLVAEGPTSLAKRTANRLVRRGQAQTPDTYATWIVRNEPDARALSEQAEEAVKLASRPRFSIVMPVWNTPARWLRAAIDSVLAQTYENWELCIADGNSTQPHVRPLLEEYAQRDKRVKVELLDENKGIAGNSNEALSLASGEFVALLDHDDELAPFALFELAKLVNDKPDLDYIYSDEDKIGTTPKRSDPFFKPDWSPDFLLGCGYTNHLSVYRRKKVEQLGRFRKEVDGSQDYDLLLRFTEDLAPDRVGHVPKVLYHWRQIAGSTAANANAKDSVVLRMAKKALEEAMSRKGVKATIADGLWPGSYRIHREIVGTPLVSIIIPTKDKLDLLRGCIESIEEKSTYRRFEILVVDNNSVEPETLAYLANLKDRALKYPGRFNFSKINNVAAREAHGDYLLFLNNDTEVITPDWLEELLQLAQVQGVGAVGCKLLYKDGSIQHAGVVLGMSPDQVTGVAGHVFRGFGYEDPGYFGAINVVRNYSAVTAACMLMPRRVFEEMGGFDERLAVCYNDVDLCLRLRERGYRVVYTPYAELFHLESVTRGVTVDAKEAQYMLDRWGSLIKHDPCFSPNLTLAKYNCELNLP